MSPEAEPARRPVGRKLAEWVTSGTSALLVLAVAGFLVLQMLQEEDPFVPAEVRVLLEEKRLERGRYIVPIEVTNQGERTLKKLKVELSYGTGQGAKQTSDFEIDFLGERAKEKVYLYFDQDPATLGIEVRAVKYELQ